MKLYRVSNNNADMCRRSVIIMMIVASCAAGVTVTSQTLNKEITVDREIVLTHREANRLTTLPRVELPALMKPDLGYAFSSSSADITNDISLLPPVTFGDTLAHSPYRGYLMPGYFPAQRINFSAGYRLIDNERTRLEFMAQYDRNNYKTRYETWYDEIMEDVFKDNTVSAALALHQVTGRDSWIDATAAYTYARHHLPSSNPCHYGVNRVGVSADFHNKKNEWSYNIGASVKYFGTPEVSSFTNANYREIDGSVRGTLEYSGSRLIKGLDYSLTVGNFLKSPEYVAVICKSYDNSDEIDNTNGLLSLTPYVKFGGDVWSGRIGVDVEFNFNRGPVFRIAPDINLGWKVARYFSVALEARGGVVRNTVSYLYDMSYLVGLTSLLDNAYVPVDAKVTLQAGSWHGLWASVSAGYSVAKDWAMPVKGDWETFDISGWRASVAAGYSWRGIAGIHASFEAAPQKYNRGYYLWRDRAGYVAQIGLDIHPLRPLTVNAGWELRGKRHTTLYSSLPGIEIPIPSLRPLRNVSDISVKASWQFTPAFSVWAEGANLLNRRWEMLVPFTAQGRNAMIGFSWLF